MNLKKIKRRKKAPTADIRNLFATGLRLHQAGDMAAAETAYRQILRISPDHTGANNNYGIILRLKGRLQDAAHHFHRALQVDPDHREALKNLGVVYKDLGRHEEAISCLERVLTDNDRDGEALINVGLAYRGLGDYGKAFDCYRRLLALYPNDACAHNNLGLLLHDQNNINEAIQEYKTALTLYPDFTEALKNLGFAYHQQYNFATALDCFRQALQKAPDNAEIYNGMAAAFIEQGMAEEAISCLKESLRIKPDNPNIHSALLFIMNYHPGLSQEFLYNAAVQWWERHGAVYSGRVKPLPAGLKKIHLGYMSPDFRTHSVSYFFLPLLAAHNREQFAVYCYSLSASTDTTTERIQRLCTHWRPVHNLSDDTIETLIRDDGIDILVDLAGHSGENRLTVFSRRPAPVQIAWLGYPNTTGLPEMDYRFTDAIADPDDTADAQYYSETLIRLPHGFLCYSPPDGTPDVTESPLKTNGYITFGSFNSLRKIHPGLIAVWARLLTRTPHSRLLLKSKQLEDESVRSRILALFSHHGIRAERIKLHSHLESIQKHFELYHQVDIGLDTFPYNGTTTTFEALWMGVPVITFRGDRHSARVGASILTGIGLEELIGQDAEDYVTIAAGLANEAERLAELRSGMRARLKNSALCNAPSFARDVEDVYKKKLGTL